ncbi:MAG: APC family permease [Thermoplasmata archaeon]|jgi:amino acid transporter
MPEDIKGNTNKEVVTFQRRSSGLRRVMSPYSAFVYNVMNIAPIFPWVYLLSAAAFPQGNIWLGILLTTFFVSFLAIAYSGIASVMPRTGGDYIFESRILGPWIGFPIVATMILFFFLQWDAIAGWLVAVLGISPMLTGLGISLNSTFLIDLGVWFTTPLGIWLTTVFAGLIALIVLIKGLHVYVKVQWVLWYSFLISFVIIVALFLITPQSVFISNYNSAVLKIDPQANPNYYQYVIDYEKSQGFSPTFGFSILSTFGIMAIALTSLGWVGYAQEQAGEIKSANSFKKQLFINLGGGIAAGLMMAILAFVLVNTVGIQWLAAAAYGSYITGNLSMPVLPWFSTLIVALTDNPILIFLATFGITLAAMQIVFNVYIGQTRVAIAASIDQVLPAWISKINGRTGTPVNVHLLFYFLGGVLYSFIYNFYPGFITYTLAVTAVATIMYIATSLSAALLPWKLKEAYSVSEVSKYKISKIPLITISGIIAALFSLWMLYYYVTDPMLGVASVPSYIFITGVFLGWLMYFAFRRYYLKRKYAIDLDDTFRNIPPL